jgi:diguanylate cyclase (GGDEF)-like protein/PAS domain S-box-containing protein
MTPVPALDEPVPAASAVPAATAAPAPARLARLARPLRRWSIRTQLMALVLALGLPFLAFVAVDAWRQARAEHRQVMQRSLGMARVVGSRLDDLVEDMDGLLAAVAAAPVRHPGEAQAYLDGLRPQLRGYIEDVSVWTPQGDWVASVSRTGPGNAAIDQGMLRAAVRSRDLAFDAPLRNARGEYVIGFARPALNPAGEVVGVIAASIRARELRRIVDPGGLLPAEALVTLVDHDGLTLARSVEQDRYAGRYIPSDDVRQHFTAREGVFEDVGIDGVPRIYGFSAATRARWLAYVGLDAAQAFTPASTRMLGVLLPGAAALLAGLAFAALAGTHIARALRGLASDAQRLSDGELTHRTGVDGQDEIGILGRALDRMAASLRERSLALAASREELSRVTANVPVLIAYIDAAQRFRFANEYHRDVFGVPPDRLVGRSLRQLFPVPTYARLAERIDEVLQGYPASFETDLDTPAGERSFLVSCFPDYGDDQAVTGFFVVCQDITRRRKAEAALEARERFTQQVTDAIPARVTYVDPAGRVQFGNRHFRQSWSAEPATYLGTPLVDLLPPDTAAKIGPHLAAALRGDSQAFELAFEKDGTLHHDLVHYVPDRGEDGAVRGVFTISQDVTALKRSESARLESERRIRLIADSVPAAMTYVNRHERYLFCNAAFTAAFERPLDDLIGRRVSDVLSPEVYAATRPHLDAVLHGERQRFQRVATRRGSRRHELVEYIPEVTGAGEVSGFFAVIHDITDLHDAQARVAASERRLRSIAESVPSLLCYIDRDLRYRFNSRYYEEWLGMPLEAITGRSVREVLGDATFAKDEPFMLRALRGERVEFDLSHSDASGTRHVRGTYVPDIDDSGEVVGIYGATSDITPLKQVEQELARLAQFDSLTGLPNRNQFNARIADALVRARRAGLGVGLLFLDIDAFKRINDTLGHSAGDAVLREFGRRLAASVRETDTVARLAGDEFVVVLEGIHRRDECLFIARKIVAAMQRPFVLDTAEIAVTTSIGIALTEDGSVGPELLLQRADAALYTAKAEGRNRYEVAG